MNSSRSPFIFLRDLKLSVVVPVFNEGPNIIENLYLLKSELNEAFKNFEIIVISDGSTDDTNEKITSIANSSIKFISLDKNLGKGSAVRKGFENSEGDYILFIDGGMELHPKDIKIFLGLMSLYNADIVVGSKRHPQSQVYYPFYRRFLSSIYQILVRNLFNVNVTDTQVGIKLFKKEVIRDILPFLTIDRYGFDLEILSLASALNYKNILEAPIRLDYFLKNKRSATLDLAHTFRVGFLLFLDTVKLYRHIAKLRPSLNKAKFKKAA